MRISVCALHPLPDLTTDDDLVGLVLEAVPDADLLVDGAVLTVSSKAVAKVEGRTVHGSRDALVDSETDRVVARRGPLRIVRTRHGLVLAAAGVDESNTAAGTVVPLPSDPDGSARRLRIELAERTGRNVAVVVTDTAGRAWRTGQTDIAVGCAGLGPLHDLTGQRDAWGRHLQVTAPAVADEVAGAAELVLGKAERTPCAVVTGLAALVLPRGEHGPGAVQLVRPEAEDLFGLGTADAVTAAVRRGVDDHRGFAEQPAELADLVETAAATVPEIVASVVDEVEPPTVVVHAGEGRAASDPAVLIGAGAVAERLRVLAWPYGLQLTVSPGPPGAVCAVSAHVPPVD